MLRRLSDLATEIVSELNARWITWKNRRHIRHRLRTTAAREK